MPCGGLVAVVVLGRFSRFRYLVVDGLSKVMGMGLHGVQTYTIVNQTVLGLFLS